MVGLVRRLEQHNSAARKITFGVLQLASEISDRKGFHSGRRVRGAANALWILCWVAHLQSLLMRTSGVPSCKCAVNPLMGTSPGALSEKGI
jgi:hypothetical protein